MKRVAIVVVVLSSSLWLGCAPPASVDVTPPTISLGTSAATVVTNATVTLTATASDDVGVTRVEFYEGETKLLEVTSPPYTTQRSFTAVDDGAHHFTARAFDAAGNTAASGNVDVVVDIDTTPPIISLAASTVEVLAPGPVTLTATATDDRGLAKVEFYEGDTRLSEDSSAPFVHVLTFTAADNGARRYTAKAIDLRGNETLSAVVAVTVAVPPPPLAPVLTLNFSLKTLGFAWSPVPGASFYRLYEDADGPGPAAATQLASDTRAVTLAHPVSLHLTTWSTATFFLKACNEAGCGPASAEVSAAAAIARAVGYLKASDTSVLSHFGVAVAVSADGTTLAVGAWGVGNSSGAVYVFARAGNGWSEQARLRASNASTGALFGYSVALSEDGSTLVAGAYAERSAGLGVRRFQVSLL